MLEAKDFKRAMTDMGCCKNAISLVTTGIYCRNKMIRNLEERNRTLAEIASDNRQRLCEPSLN